MEIGRSGKQRVADLKRSGMTRRGETRWIKSVAPSAPGHFLQASLDDDAQKGNETRIVGTRFEVQTFRITKRRRSRIAFLVSIVENDCLRLRERVARRGSGVVEEYYTARSNPLTFLFVRFVRDRSIEGVCSWECHLYSGIDTKALPWITGFCLSKPRNPI